MTSPEYGPRSVIGFYEATQQLPDGDGLVLSRNGLKLIHKGRVEHDAPVHYEDLNYLSEIYRPIDSDKIVTDEFQEAVQTTLREQGETPQTSYPLLTVINRSTSRQVSETVNVAKLINVDELPVYARSTASGGEVISLGMSTLVKIMAERVGVNPVGAVVFKDGEVRSVEDAMPRLWTHSTMNDEQNLVGDSLDLDNRGATVLSLLQLDIAQAFIQNKDYRDIKSAKGRVEVVLNMVTPPDLQTILLSLIDSLESWGTHLYYTRNELPNKEIRSVFSAVDDNFGVLYELSSEEMLDIAVQNAYLTAVRKFQE